jgi:hypothetical protein
VSPGLLILLAVIAWLVLGAAVGAVFGRVMHKGGARDTWSDLSDIYWLGTLMEAPPVRSVSSDLGQHEHR